MSVFLDKLDKDKVFLDKDKMEEETTHRQRTTSLARRASTISAILAARRRDADDDEEEEECEGDHDTITSLAGARLLQDYQQKLKH